MPSTNHALNARHRLSYVRRVAVVGVGLSKFGERWEAGLRDLIVEAGVNALKDAGLEGKDIEALYVGTMAAGRLIGQEHIGSLIADWMGLNPLPSTRVEAACASGGLAVKEGFMAVASGMYDVVVVGGVEKMTELSTSQVTYALGGAGDQEWELSLGATFPSLYALMARRHMYEYGTTEEQMAQVAVKNHKFGVHNPYAQFRKPVTVEQVLASKPVAEPLKLLDSSPISDGAAVVVLMELEKAKKLRDELVEIIGVGHATDSIALHDRSTFTGIRASSIAMEKALRMAKIERDKIKVAEVHDCFTIAEIMAIEDLGFFPKGQGGRATEEGETDLNGKITVNTSGGLKACGHPVGATGVKQIAEITWQLRGEAEGRQVDTEYGLTHNVGGSGATAVVHILKRLR